jgi:hypothetical protein
LKLKPSCTDGWNIERILTLFSGDRRERGPTSLRARLAAAQQHDIRIEVLAQHGELSHRLVTRRRLPCLIASGIPGRPPSGWLRQAGV